MTAALLATSFGGFLLRVVLAVTLAAVITVISLRLLGVRRGWTKALAAGLLGWGAAWLLALSLAHWDWGADGLAVHVIAIGIPATMAAAVTLDLMARPGTLSTGERSGLFTTPRPFRAVRRRIDVLLRYRELLRLARREGFGPASGGRAAQLDAPTGVRLRHLLEEAGGVSVKLGQIAATRVDLVPPDIAELQPWWTNFAFNIATVQFTHRILAIAVALMAIGLWFEVRRDLPNPRARFWSTMLVVVVVLQVALGIVTLLTRVPLNLGVLHQAGALVAFSVALLLRHSLREVKQFQM